MYGIHTKYMANIPVSSAKAVPGKYSYCLPQSGRLREHNVNVQIGWEGSQLSDCIVFRLQMDKDLFFLPTSFGGYISSTIQYIYAKEYQ